MRAWTHSKLISWRKHPQAGLLLIILAASTTWTYVRTIQPNPNSRFGDVSAWEHYWGIDAPAFDAFAPKSAPSCFDIFRASATAAAAANCTTHRSSSLPVALQSCTNPGAASGVLILRRDDDVSGLHGPAELLGTAIYRLRVVGPAGVWLLEPAYCRPDLAAAAYALPLPGRYSIEIVMLYSSFSFTNPGKSKSVQAPWAAYLTLEVGVSSSGAQPLSATAITATATTTAEAPLMIILRQSWSSEPDATVVESPEADSSGAAASSLSQLLLAEEANRVRQLPVCNTSGPVPGRWRFRAWPPSPAAVAAPLLCTCIFSNTSHGSCNSGARAMLHHAAAHPAGLYWQPDGCRMPPVRDLTLKGGCHEGDASQQLHNSGEHDAITSCSSSSSSTSRRSLGAQRQTQQQQQLARDTIITPERCFPPGRRVCFIGDSHSRYLHNSVVMWLSNFTIKVDNSIKQELQSDRSFRFIVHWGSDWPPGDSLATEYNCTDVLGNVGQWATSHLAGPEPRSAASYMSSVRHIRSNMLALRRAHGTRVFWVTSCLSSLQAQFTLTDRDWRTDPYLSLFNRLASDIMRGGALAAEEAAKLPGVTAAAAGRGGGGGGDGGSGGDGGGASGSAVIPVIDVWSPTHILSDLTGDGTHFENTGLVGRVLLHTVLHALCSDH